METCRAAVITAHNKPLTIEQVHIPVLDPGSLLIKIAASTLCGTDVHRWHGNFVSARDDRGKILIGAHFVIPLDELTHDIPLIARFLPPVNILALAGAQFAFGDRRPAGNEKKRHVA